MDGGRGSADRRRRQAGGRQGPEAGGQGQERGTRPGGRHSGQSRGGAGEKGSRGEGAWRRVSGNWELSRSRNSVLNSQICFAARDYCPCSTPLSHIDGSIGEAANARQTRAWFAHRHVPDLLRGEGG